MGSCRSHRGLQEPRDGSCSRESRNGRKTQTTATPRTQKLTINESICTNKRYLAPVA